ncbi:MAG: ATP-binding protein [Bacteroidetes bacterium]|nr:ATP-binding protein [Bacteroidota bacterium]
MKQIVLMSGKGGTGKTTIAAALAMLAGKDAVMADCDVDASNLHLLLRPKIRQETEFSGSRIPMFDSRACTNCGLCATACVYDAIVFRNDQYQVDETACEGCAVCSHVCPYGYITMMPRVTGRWFVSRSRFGQHMVHARLGIGQENSGKLVARVKTEAVETAERDHVPFVLIDGPPGVGCPAIASVSGASEVLLVTEATRAGRHDLTRLIELLEHFALPASCVINKADLDQTEAAEIRRLCRDHDIPILAELPWMELFPSSLREGKTLLEMSDDGIREQISNIWESITTNGVHA